MVLECGGNGRSFFTPQARGNQWTNGGAGCAEWTGVRLSDVLKAAGVKSSARVHRPLRHRPAALGRRQQGRDLARRADQEGDGRQQPDRVRDERPAAAAHPWRAGAALVMPGWPGSVSAKWFTRHLGARQVARRPGHGRYVLPRRDQADGAGRQGRSKAISAISNRCRCARSSPARRTAPSCRPAPRRCKLRGAAWAGDLTRAARRRVDRLRRHLDARQARASRRTSTTGSAGPRR